MVDRWGTASVVTMTWLVACGPRGAPPAARVAGERPAVVAERFVDRVPASTRALVRLDREGLDQYRDPLMALMAASASARATGGDCGEPWFEIDGAITLADAVCVTGQVPLSDGSIRIGDFTITARVGGLRIADHDGFPRGAAAGLATRFERGAAGEHVFVAADLGAPGRPVRIDAAVRGAGSRATIDVEVAADADRLQAVLERAAAVVRDAGGPIAVSRSGAAVTVDASEAGVGPALALRTAALEAFKIPSLSMWPSLELGDFVFALKGDLQGPVRRGDVVVFRVGRSDFVSRVAALPGERIRIDEGQATVDGVAVPQTARGSRSSHDQWEMNGAWEPFSAEVAGEVVGGTAYEVAIERGRGDPVVDVVVPPGHFFALGDNRGNSNDSRYRGPIPLADVVGRVALVWLSRGPDGLRWDRIMRRVD